MATIMADNMVPGLSYQGTADGPEALDGVTFHVVAMATFTPADDDNPLVQVTYEVDDLPLPCSEVFAPGDIVFPMAPR